ncbi:diguanylate cyclase [Roseateles sp. DAIF2]|uniref:diguanylate cyclase domain-containing protein n=1 Tax=Roseateles sp. DAIF2 TaxID=2714952 RepID=UPI0018A2D36A|nr:diguanylate cyclase [Roseateles sp. DAIF2]QPF73721.1 diguanylate cyclase [Roseateles sp. DAIF2]
MQIAGYRLQDLIYANGATVVTRATNPLGQVVVLKYIDGEQPPPAIGARWRHEYAVLQGIDSPWVIKALGLLESERRPVLVLEDFAASNLAQLIERQVLNLEERLTLAVQLCQALSAVHQHGLIHGDIAPKNVLVDLAGLRIKLCDFALSSPLAPAQQQLEAYGALRGTLDYVSPEQTGRTGLEVDYRSDFYSLGITLYELFAGRKPFQFADPIALLHAQLALMPTPLHELDPELPQPLSALVHKLLAKYPDERYQSSYGLLQDLSHCLEQWRQQRRIEPFALARADIPERLCIAQKLYGREAAIQGLLAAFERASEGRPELLLVGGYSGIGKTALVGELHRPVVARRGYFLRGKCDQYSRNEPYAALGQALRQLLQQLAAEGPERRHYWRGVLLQALGDNAAVVGALLPDMTLLTGTLAPPAPLPVAETEQRLHIAFKQFMHALAQRAHPLLMFLDDLQWVDEPSLRLLRQLLQGTDEGPSSLLIIGAYRDNEVDAGHPLALLIQELSRSEERPLQTLKLAPLDAADVAQLVADTLRRPSAEVAELAALCLEKTQGNPFFLGQFLRDLHGHGDLRYERRQGAWHWDLAQIRRRDITDNVVTLMLQRLRDLPEATQALLAKAALLGDRVDLRELMALGGRSAAATAALLRPALQSGLVLPLGEDYKFEQSPQLLEGARYRFLHDRVQQAAHDLTPAAALPALRLHCGRRLLAASGPAELESRLFVILDCLNQAARLIDDAAERERLLELNLRAGQRAKAASAHGAACALLRQAMALRGARDWQDHPERTLTLFRALAEAEYLAGNFEAAERLYPEVQTACPDPLGRISMQLVQVDQYHIQGRFADGYAVLQQALGSMGQPFPDDAEAAALFPAEFEATERLLEDLGRDAVLHAPEMLSPTHRLEMQLYYAMSHASYQSGRFGAFALDACRMLRTTLRHGQDDLSCIAYAAYMSASAAMRKPYPQSYALGRLAMRLAEQRDNAHVRLTIYQYFSAFYQHWCDPLGETLAKLDRGVEMGQSGLNPLDAGYAALLGQLNRFLLGQELGELETRCEQSLKFLQKTHQGATEAMLRHGVLQPLRALRGKTLTPLSFDSEDCRSSELFQRPDVAPSIPLALFCVAQLRHAYLMGDAPAWRLNAARLPLVAACLPDSPAMVEGHFYAALGALREGFAEDADEGRVQALALLERFETWAEGCNANFAHKRDLIAAELARAQGEERAAMGLYVKAIESAGAAGFGAIEGLANEAYARFWSALQQPQLAGHFLREAHYHYQRWGALVKCRQLEDQWPQLPFGVARRAGSGSSSGGSYRDPLESGFSVDLHALLKANQLLAQEIHLDSLLPQMLGVLLQHAGAERGAIVLDEDESLVVEAIGGLDERGRLASQRLCMPLAELGDQGQALLPSGLIEYARLTRRTLVLNRPEQDERFSHSEYLRQQAPRSVICLPVLSQGKLVALVYMENTRLENAFTTRHQQTLELLSSQAAISLVNARLYENLENKVALRTEELRQMSMRDGLTGVANRRAFDERLQLEWRRSQRQGSPLALLMMDIDFFKQFNDHYGHLEGDRCIRAVAQQLQRVACRSTDLLARYGGEEFALLLPDTDVEAAQRLAQACLEAVEALAFAHAQSTVGPHVSLSLGCASIVASGEAPPEQLVAAADRALYRAKREGRRRWVGAELTA